MPLVVVCVSGLVVTRLQETAPKQMTAVMMMLFISFRIAVSSIHPIKCRYSRSGIILSSFVSLVIYKTLLMQDNRREFSGDELQNKQNSEPGFTPDGDSKQTQQVGQQLPIQDTRSTLEPGEIDKQEGNMNHGTLGGNFGEDAEH